MKIVKGQERQRVADGFFSFKFQAHVRLRLFNNPCIKHNKCILQIRRNNIFSDKKIVCCVIFLAVYLSKYLLLLFFNFFFYQPMKKKSTSVLKFVMRFDRFGDKLMAQTCWLSSKRHNLIRMVSTFVNLYIYIFSLPRELFNRIGSVWNTALLVCITLRLPVLHQRSTVSYMTRRHTMGPLHNPALIWCECSLKVWISCTIIT